MMIAMTASHMSTGRTQLRRGRRASVARGSAVDPIHSVSFHQSSSARDRMFPPTVRM